MMTLLFLTAAFGAELNAPDFTVSAARKGSDVEVTAKPPAGHHINVEAPMELEDLSSRKKIKARAKKEAEAVFTLPGSKSRSYAVTLYLCDDALTFCEKHRVSGEWTGASAQTDESPPAAPAAAPAPNTTPQQKPAGRPRPDANGFYVNQPAAALAAAASGGKPMLIDFFGIWCPPCNMLDEEVFPSREFRNAASGFVKLKLDADSEVSWALKSKYKVGGYPTVVFVSAGGDEISRVVGFRPKGDFVAEVRSAWRNRENPLSKLLEKAETGDVVAAERAGLILLERKDFAGAAKLLSRVPHRKETFLEARAGTLEGKELLEHLEEAVAEFAHSPGTLGRHMRLADLYEERGEKEKSRTQLTAAVVLAKELLDLPAKLAGHDLGPADLWSYSAQAHERLGEEAKAREAWSAAAAENRKRLAKLKGADSSAERGYNLELAYCLWKSGMADQAEALYRGLQKRYPAEFTFYYAHASMSHELKRREQALELALKALTHSYGDNKLRAAHLAARAYEALGRREEALKTVRETLSAAALPGDTSIRTHRYAGKLKELESSLVLALKPLR